MSDKQSYEDLEAERDGFAEDFSFAHEGKRKAEDDIQSLRSRLAAQDKRVEMIKGVFAELLHHKHHGIDEEYWRIDEALAFCAQTDEEITGKRGGRI